MMLEEPSIIEVELSGVGSKSELLKALAVALQLQNEAPQDWQDYARALMAATIEPRRLVLKSLQELEVKLPYEAQAMMRAFADYNSNNPDSTFSLEVSADYRAPVYFLRFLAERPARKEESRQGAYVSCWIKRTEVDDAKAVATAAIEESGWRVRSVEDCHLVSSDDYPTESPESEYFWQSLVDGEVYVFDWWEE